MILSNNYKYWRLIDIKELQNIILIFKFLFQISYISFNYFSDAYILLNIYSYIDLFFSLIDILKSNKAIIIIYNCINLELIGYCYYDTYDLYIKNYKGWLCDLFIINKYRNNGYSKLILNKFNKIYRNHYLYCSKKLVKYYKKLGYQFLFTYNTNNIKYIFYNKKVK
jgi:hypothetical protein